MADSHQSGKILSESTVPGVAALAGARLALAEFTAPFSYRRERDLPRLLGTPAARLPPPGPDYTLRLLARLRALAETPSPALPGWPRPTPLAARIALHAEMALISSVLSSTYDNPLFLNEKY